MSSEDSHMEEIAGLLGYPEVPDLLADAAAAVSRGHHLALLAGEGSGGEALCALCAAQDCDPEVAALQAIVLVPTQERATRMATALVRGLRGRPLRVLSPASDPHGHLDVAGLAKAHCIVARPSTLLPEVRAGRLPLGELRLFVMDGVADLVDLDEWPSVEPLLDTLRPETRRIVFSRRVDEHLLSLLRRQLPRARRWPEELFEISVELPGRDAPPVTFAAAAAEPERLRLLATWLRRSSEGGAARVVCQDEPSAGQVASALLATGLPVTEQVGRVVDVARETDPESGPEGRGAVPMAVAFGLPVSLAAFREALGAAPRRLAVVDAAHLPQLRILALRAGWTLRPLAGIPLGEELEPLAAYRRQIVSRIEDEDTDAELLVLEPLLGEHGAARVAAALSSLLRSRAGPDSVRPWPDVEAASLAPTGTPQAPARAPSHRGARTAWSRVFIGAGRRDEVRAADLVGAITGETGVAGAQIGRIDIRGAFSLVEIDSQVVDEVIQRLRGSAIRGRQVAVHLDRES